jgi:hypothetical protein
VSSGTLRGVGPSPAEGGSSGSPFTINVVAVGPVAGFVNTNSYTWTIASFNSITLLSPAPLTVTTTGFTAGGPNDPGAGVFTALVSDGALQVLFTPVPEPAQVLLLCAVAGLAARRWRRARRFDPAVTLA